MYDYHERFDLLKKFGIQDINVAIGLELGQDMDIFYPRNETGFLFQCDSMMEQKLALVVEVGGDSGLLFFQTGGAGKVITPLGDLTPDDAVKATFVKRMTTCTDRAGDQVMKDNDFQANHLWAMFVNPLGLQMWQIGIVTRVDSGYTHYYLSLQPVYSADIYDDQGKIVVPEDQFPGYAKWASLQEFLCRNDIHASRPIAEYKPAVKESIKLRVNECQMIWFNQCKRHGLAKNMNGIVGIVHASEIIEASGNDKKPQDFPALDNGQVVSFRNMIRTRNPHTGKEGWEFRGIIE